MFTHLAPELFQVIFAHIPLSDRASTKLSLALVSQHLCDIIIPHHLYREVLLIGEEQALQVLKGFLRGVKAANNDNDKGGTIFPSECVHYLCIDTNVEIESPDTVIANLQSLAHLDGLRNLVSLTIHVKPEGCGRLPMVFWRSFREHCPSLTEVHLTGIAQDQGDEWIQASIFKIQQLTSIRLECDVQGSEDPANFVFRLSSLPQYLHTLELRLLGQPGHHLNACAEGLLSMVLPNLTILILDTTDVGDPALTRQFWVAHPRLERLELLRRTKGNWFEDFQSGMLPNLKFFMSDFGLARAILPYVYQSLIGLYLIDTYNAQAPYLLRTIPLNGTFPSLRSLGINRKRSGNSTRLFEGHRWREDEDGVITEMDVRSSARRFDGNYLMSIAKAAPNLEELELMGDSDDTIESITASLSQLQKLNRLTLSGPTNTYNRAFFDSSKNWTEYSNWEVLHSNIQFTKYAPLSFKQAVEDLANGCRTLETITFGQMIGCHWIAHGISGKVVRETELGRVKKVERIRAWGNGIGREQEW